MRGGMTEDKPRERSLRRFELQRSSSPVAICYAEFCQNGAAGRLLLCGSLHDESHRNFLSRGRNFHAKNPVVLIIVVETGYCAVGLYQAKGAGVIRTRRLSTEVHQFRKLKLRARVRI